MIKIEKNMFLNIMIVLSFCLLFVLVGIKYGRLLSIFAIILSFVALVPYAISIFLYFSSVVNIEYTLTKTKVHFDDNQNYADIVIDLRTKGRSGILKAIYLIPECCYNISEHPMLKKDFDKITLEEGFDAISFVINNTDNLISDHMLHNASVRLSKNDRNEISIIKMKLIVDIQVDPVKLGFYSIFQPNYMYRYIGNIVADFKNKNSEKGKLHRAY